MFKLTKAELRSWVARCSTVQQDFYTVEHLATQLRSWVARCSTV